MKVNDTFKIRIIIIEVCISTILVCLALFVVSWSLDFQLIKWATVFIGLFATVLVGLLFFVPPMSKEDVFYGYKL